MLRRSSRACKSKGTVEPNSNEPPIKRKCSPLNDSSSDNDDNSSGDEFLPANLHLTEMKQSCSLNLSESDSDNDVRDYETKVKPLQQSDTESEADDNMCRTNFDFTALLNPRNTMKIPQSDVKSETVESVEKNGPDNLDVAKILSVGEGVNLETVLNNEEKLKRDDDYTIPKMVEIAVKLPSDMKCKKGQDIQDVLRKRMNTICKDTQILIHKVNLLLWITYGNRLNCVLNSPEVMGSALSLIPSEKAYPPKQCDLNYLENYMKWFSKNIKISSKTDPLCKITVLSLVENFSKREAKTRYELIAMFISMLRSLGLNVRLVINLNAVPIKPNSEQLLGPLNDEDHMKQSNSKSKMETKRKTPAKSEYFNKKSNNKKLDTKNSKINDEKKSKNHKKSKITEEIYGNISSSDEEDDIFVKNSKNAKSEYFNKKITNKLQTNLKKSNSKKSKSANNNTKSKNLKSKISEKIDRRVLSTDEDDVSTPDDHTSVEISKKKVKNDFWAEVFLEMEEKWFCVDVIGQRLHCIKEIYESNQILYWIFIAQDVINYSRWIGLFTRCLITRRIIDEIDENGSSHPMRYVLAWYNNNSVKDVTKRYDPYFHTLTRKLRVSPEWWTDTLRPYTPPRSVREREEDKELDKQLEETPLPKTVSEYKNHPLYVLSRHLLKFQALYPPDPPVVGHVKNEPVFLQKYVHELNGRDNWLKEARVVKMGEQSYKKVKSRPRFDRNGVRTDPPPLELFGYWQTEPYDPPTATNGQVPRNCYGNVDLFKPCMLPKGTVHLKLPGLLRIAKKLNIDCAPAIVGFDFHAGGSHPVNDGFVVCLEYKDILTDAWNQEVEESHKRQQQKHEDKVYGNWRRLVKAVLIRERLKVKYDFFGGDKGQSTSKATTSKEKKK